MTQMNIHSAKTEKRLHRCTENTEAAVFKGKRRKTGAETEFDKLKKAIEGETTKSCDRVETGGLMTCGETVCQVIVKKEL